MSPPAPEISPSRVSRTPSEIRQWILAEVAHALNVQPAEVDAAAPLDSHGLNSVAAISITGKLSTWLDRKLPATLLWDNPNINAVAESLADAADRPALPSGVIAMHAQSSADTSRPPLFLFPGVGGHPVTFSFLAHELRESQPCFGLTVPGLDGKSPPLNNIEAIAAAMVKNLRLVQPSGSYQLAGYSFGGLLAFEAARQLQAAGQTVSLLAIFDTFAPGARTPRPLWQRLALHAYLLSTQPDRLKYLRGRVDRFREIHRFEDQTPTPAEAGSTQEIVQLIQDHNLQAAHCYKPGAYTGSLVWFTATQRQRHNLFYKIDPSGGWKQLSRDVQIIRLPGTHLNMLDAHHAKAAAESLRPFLAAVPADRSPQKNPEIPTSDVHPRAGLFLTT